MKHYWLDELDGLIIEADILDALNKVADESVEAIITDPPYELGFMGKSWDDQGVSFRRETWEACLRVLKPGGHIIVFGGTRTHHRMWCAIEDAGFEIRDMIVWLYGQGFPKSLDVSRAIDKAAKGHPQGSTKGDPDSPNSGKFKTQATEGKRSPSDPGQQFGAGPGQFMKEQGIKYERRDLAKDSQTWAGWGTALKPAWEPILLARKPLSEKNVAANVLKWGTGALNIDGTRLDYLDDADKASATPQGRATSKESVAIGAQPDSGRELERVNFTRPEQKGRWPSNAVLQCTCVDPEPVAEKTTKRRGETSQDRRYTEKGATNFAVKPGTRRKGGGAIHEPDCPAGMLDEQTGITKSAPRTGGEGEPYDPSQESWRFRRAAGGFTDTGGASRFFYCPKASKKERGPNNSHPTVKPLELMRWLARLVTPPEGVILDPFCGSGSTLIAAADEGFGFIGVDMNPEYCEIARERLVRRET